MDNMTQKLIRCFICAVILILLGWVAKILIVATGAPAILWTVIVVFLILIFVLFLGKTFGVLT